MNKEQVDVKHFNMRMPRDLWLFLKHSAASQGTSMTDIIVDCLDKYKKKIEKKLTETDAYV